MKKWLIGGGIAVGLIAIAVGLCVWLWPRGYELSSEYYGNGEIASIDIAELRELTGDKKSFALLIYQPNCRASEDFEKIVKEFTEREQVGFEKIAFSEVKSSGLLDELQYYPSVVLYRDGEVVTFLKTDEDKDLAAYQSLDGFTEWWKGYVKEK